MNRLQQNYNLLFVSACRLSAIVRSQGESYEIAYWWISLCLGVNFTSVLMMARYMLGFDIIISRSVFIILFFVTPFVINYYVFLQKARHKKISKQINASSKPFLIYLFITFMFFIGSGYLNIP